LGLSLNREYGARHHLPESDGESHRCGNAPGSRSFQRVNLELQLSGLTLEERRTVCLLPCFSELAFKGGDALSGAFECLLLI
jgi:hypothetical protein